MSAADAGADGLLASATASLSNWRPVNAGQDEARLRYLARLAEQGGGALHRHPHPEHLTASCFVFSPDLSRLLLCFHNKGAFWVQLGGHIEPADAGLADAALREAGEESGLAGLRLAVPHVVDLDVHALASAFGHCRRHWDVGFAAIADPAEPVTVSAESADVRWWPVEALPDGAADSMQRRVAHVLAELRRAGGISPR